MPLVKRVFLFIVLNAVVLLTVSLILNLFSVQPYLKQRGLDYQSLMVFCLVWGMTGAFISLAISRMMAKWMMGVEVIDPNSASAQEQQLLNMVHMLAKNAGLPSMPEVGIYPSNEINAFATGPSSSRALVAVSSGLIRRMNSAEMEGVLAHEVTHIANGDMVTMTLLQGVINAFVMFFARVLAFAVSRLGRDRDSESIGSPFLYGVLVFVFEIVFMILGSLVVAAYSRHREFRADAGGARLAGRERMVAALHALERFVSVKDERSEQQSFQAFKISSRGMFRLFASHPPLDERIRRLESGRY